MQNLVIQKNTFSFLVAAFIGLFVFSFYPTISDLWIRWNKFDESYSHGILVLLISAYLLYLKVKAFPSIILKPTPMGLLLIFGSSLLWMLAYFASIEAIQELLLPWIIWLFIYTIMGWNSAKHFAFPVGFLYFAIPFWDALTVPLQYITTDVNGILLSMAGVTAHIEDVFVTLPVGKFEIAGGCSGLRYLIISITLTSLYSYLNYTRYSSAAILVISSIFMALVANWLRVFIIILAGNATDMQHSLVNEHDHFGWLVFAITLIPIFYLAHKLERTIATDTPTANTKTTKHPPPLENNAISSTLIIIFTFVVTFSAPNYAMMVTNNYSPESSITQVSIPLKLGGWQRSYLKNHLIVPPSFNNADFNFDAIYTDGNNTDLQLSIRSYMQQSPGKELISFSNRLFNSEKFLKTASGNIKGPESPFGYVILKNNNQEKELISYQYDVSHIKTSSRLNAKLLEVARPLVGSPPSQLIYTRMKCQTDCSNESKITSTFLADNHLELTEILKN